MDNNKLKVLRDINYSIPRTCGLCKHARLGHYEWGTCEIQTYDHLKHGNERQLSISRYGSCAKWQENEAATYTLDRFREFLEGEKE